MPYFEYNVEKLILRKGILELFGVRLNKNTRQKIGEFCKGKNIEYCKKYFGEELANVCKVCPN